MSAIKDPLLEACRMVGGRLKINIVRPDSWAYDKCDNPIGEIARASQIRYRQIALTGHWWKSDCGPIVAFKQDASPVALLPHSPSTYYIHDPLNEKVEKITDKNKGDLKIYGYVFYRPLPNKKIDLLDIIKFGLETDIKKDLAIFLAASILGGLSSILLPVAMWYLFDKVMPSKEKILLVKIVLFLLAVSLSMVLYQVARAYAVIRISTRLNVNLQAALWDRLLSLPVSFFRGFSAEMLTMTAMNINEIKSMLTNLIANSLYFLIFALINIGFLSIYSPKIALYVAFSTFIFLLVTLYLSVKLTPYQQEANKLSHNLKDLVHQLINSLSKIRMSGVENRAFSRWFKPFSESTENQHQIHTLQNLLGTWQTLFPLVLLIVVLIAAAQDKNLSTGSFMACNTASILLIIYMSELLKEFPHISKVIVLCQELKPILNNLPELNEKKLNPGELKGSLEVKNLSFRYRQDGPYILRNVSLKINPGEYLAIVGKSGSGKSTLLRILTGFEKPESGKVIYNGNDLEDLDIRTVRKQLGVVLQNSKLIAGTLFMNIVGAGQHLTIDDAWEAVGLAGIDKEIRELPMGMHTIVSDEGGTLSGGQKQRILIARALAKKPRLLLFDEATSALDHQSQKLIKNTLEKITATRIVVAHRLNTIKDCHRIIVLDQGKIVEQGNYQDLMKKEDHFFQLVKHQGL